MKFITNFIRDVKEARNLRKQRAEADQRNAKAEAAKREAQEQAELRLAFNFQEHFFREHKVGTEYHLAGLTGTVVGHHRWLVEHNGKIDRCDYHYCDAYKTIAFTDASQRIYVVKVFAHGGIKV